MGIRKDKYLVDGSLVNPVPVSVLKGMGADFIIAVNVIPDINNRVQRAKDFKEPNIISVIMQSIYIGAYSLVESSLAGADIVIEPRVGHIGTGDFHRAEECILQSKLAAEDSVPGIKNNYKSNFSVLRLSPFQLPYWAVDNSIFISLEYSCK